MQLVWLSTAIVFFHTFIGICFIPKTHTQMNCFHTWCKIFIPICYNQNHMVCNRLVSPGVWKMCPRYETSPQRYENKNLKVWNFFYKVWNFCIGVWKKFSFFWGYETIFEGMKKYLLGMKKIRFLQKIVSYPRVWKYQLFFPDVKFEISRQGKVEGEQVKRAGTNGA